MSPGREADYTQGQREADFKWMQSVTLGLHICFLFAQPPPWPPKIHRPWTSHHCKLESLICLIPYLKTSIGIPLIISTRAQSSHIQLSNTTLNRLRYRERAVLLGRWVGGVGFQGRFFGTRQKIYRFISPTQCSADLVWFLIFRIDYISWGLGRGVQDLISFILSLYLPFNTPKEPHQGQASGWVGRGGFVWGLIYLKNLSFFVFACFMTQIQARGALL